MKLKPILISGEVKHHNIILVDAEAMIEEDDLFYDSVTSKIHMASDTHETWENESKIIASTTSSHNLPLLSAKATSILIDYYNKNKCMPEFVEVEFEIVGMTNGWIPSYNNPDNSGCHPPAEPMYGPKLNQEDEIDITIPEVEEKLYTKEEMINFACDVYNKQLSTQTCRSFREVANEMVQRK